MPRDFRRFPNVVRPLSCLATYREYVSSLVYVVDGKTGWVDAAELARRFGVSRDWVYDNAERLGVIRLGDGPKARMRFDPAIAAQRLSAPGPQPPPSPKRSTGPSVELLPIRERREG